MNKDAQDAMKVQTEPNFKNLASCKPTEFVRQTARIKKAAESWMKATKIIEILRRRPEGGYKELPENATAEERAEVLRENAKIKQDLGMKNLSDIFDAAFAENPEKTLEILALCCFVEPEHVDDYPVSAYLKSFNDLLHDETVIGFFTSLTSLAQPNTQPVLKVLG